MLSRLLSILQKQKPQPNLTGITYDAREFQVSKYRSPVAMMSVLIAMRTTGVKFSIQYQDGSTSYHIQEGDSCKDVTKQVVVVGV